MDDVLAVGQVVEVDQAGVQPLVVRVLGRELGLDLVVLDDPVLVGVDQEHPARLEPALAGDRGGVEVEDADLGGEHHQAVVGDPVARGAQPVAVEHGADLGAVGEHHARRAVPRLHQRGVELVERPGRVHLAARTVVLARVVFSHASGIIISTACGSDRPPRWSSSRTSSNEAESDAPGRADRVEPVEVAGDQVGVEQRLAGPHPVAVAHDGVDLAVVGDEPERVGQRPARERVGREPRVDHGQRRGHPLVDQVGVEVVELLGGEHALVDQGARRERREVRVGLVLDPLAQAVGLPLQGHAADPGAGTRDEELGEGRHHAAGGRAEHVGLGRDVAPAQDREVLLGGELLDATAGLGDRVGVAGQERGADGVRPVVGQVEVDDGAQERVGHLQQDPGAVTGVGLGAGGAAVVEVAQRGAGLGHDVVAGLARQRRDEGDTAGVVLVARVVEALGGWERVRHGILPSSSDRCPGSPVRRVRRQ